MRRTPPTRIRPARAIATTPACIALVLATLAGCAGDPIADAKALPAAADRGDWPLVRATYARLLERDGGDVLPGGQGEVYADGWVQYRPEQDLDPHDRVGYEVCRAWDAAVDDGDPDAAQPLALPALSANARTARPAHLANMCALLALHRAAWLSADTPAALAETIEAYAVAWTRALDATPTHRVSVEARNQIARAFVLLCTEALTALPTTSQAARARVSAAREAWLRALDSEGADAFVREHDANRAARAETGWPTPPGLRDASTARDLLSPAR